MLYGIHSIKRDDNIAVVYVRRPPEIPGVAYLTFGSLADAGVDVDIILQTASVGHGSDFIFTIHAEDTEKARQILEEEFSGQEQTQIEIDPTAVKISVSGEGMQGKPGVAAKVFKCLWDADVRILNTSTSEIKICMLVPERDADRAYQALLNGFEIV